MYSDLMFPDQLLFELSCKNTETQKHGNTETRKDRNTHTHTHAHTHTHTHAHTHKL